MLKEGDVIEYLADVRSPSSQAGTKGQTKEVGREITVFAAKLLLNGSYVKVKTAAKKQKEK